MYNSNLQVTESLEINKSLSLIQNLPLKELKYYLKKISIKYSNLYVSITHIIAQRFKGHYRQIPIDYPQLPQK